MCRAADLDPRITDETTAETMTPMAAMAQPLEPVTPNDPDAPMAQPSEPVTNDAPMAQTDPYMQVVELQTDSIRTLHHYFKPAKNGNVQ